MEGAEDEEEIGGVMQGFGRGGVGVELRDAARGQGWEIGGELEGYLRGDRRGIS